jgi:hypothetical protein
VAMSHRPGARGQLFSGEEMILPHFRTSKEMNGLVGNRLIASDKRLMTVE